MYFYYNKASSHKMLNHYNFPDIYQPKNNCCYYKCSPVYSYKHLLSKYIFGFLKHQIKTAVHKNGLRFYLVSFYSHSTNPIIWGCISYTFTGITFANLLIFYLLFLAANFLSIKIVSQKAGEYNYLLHRFPGYSAIENTLIYRKFSFIALDAFRSGRSRHPWTL